MHRRAPDRSPDLQGDGVTVIDVTSSGSYINPRAALLIVVYLRYRSFKRLAFLSPLMMVVNGK